jgi:NitT/TauT family transport system substrate-binding protein
MAARASGAPLIPRVQPASRRRPGPGGPSRPGLPRRSSARSARARRPTAAVLVLAVALLGAACSGGDGGADGAGGEPGTLRLGYFPNLTHATALVGVEKGIFQRQLGPVRLKTSSFNAGPAATEALLSGAVDATYIGPNPAINAFVKSDGEGIRIVSGATSGGAFLVVRPEIRGAADLKGRKVATPQLGNTQDVALRSWLAGQGLKTTPEGGGDVSIVPQENAQTLATFQSGEIDGAWVPEPWATRLEREGGAKMLVAEATLWPGGRYVTTHLIVRRQFLESNRPAVEALLRGQVEADAFVNDHPAEAQRLVNQGIGKLTGKGLEPPTVQAAWKRLTFTNDPVASSLRTSAANAEALGFLDSDDLDGIYDLGPLNGVLAAQGQAQVPV